MEDSMAKSWFVELMEETDPELAQLFASNRDCLLGEGAIPAKYKTLMTLLADALLGHANGVHSIAARARGMGVTEDEIRETVRVAYDVGGTPALVTAMEAFRK